MKRSDIVEAILDDEVQAESDDSAESENTTMSEIAERKINEKWAVILVSLIIFFLAESLISKLL